LDNLAIVPIPARMEERQAIFCCGISYGAANFRERVPLREVGFCTPNPKEFVMNQNNNSGQQGDNKPGQPNQQPNQQPSQKPGQGGQQGGQQK